MICSITATRASTSKYPRSFPYSADFVRHRRQNGQSAGVADLTIRPAWRFFRAYVLRRGFLDGWQGFYIASLTAFSTLTRYSQGAGGGKEVIREVKPSIALIINTYDQPDYLRRVLRAISGQVSVPAEVLLADDGSDERTAQVFKDWAAAQSGRSEHVWQAHRASAARASSTKPLRGRAPSTWFSWTATPCRIRASSPTISTWRSRSDSCRAIAP
jgi:hypothetical protein